jgi:hypothetical protein
VFPLYSGIFIPYRPPRICYFVVSFFAAFFLDGATPDSKTIVKFENGFKIGRALPRGPAMMRFIVNALPHQISLTNKVSTGKCLLCSAFATADNNVFKTSPETRFF